MNKQPFKIKCSEHKYGRPGSHIVSGKLVSGTECKVCGHVKKTAKR